MLKKLKGEQALALQLYETGNGDAQYFAGMIADGQKMTAKQVQRWAEKASWQMISGTTVPWVAAEHPEVVGRIERVMREGRTESPIWPLLASLDNEGPGPRTQAAAARVSSRAVRAGR